MSAAGFNLALHYSCAVTFSYIIDFRIILM